MFKHTFYYSKEVVRAGKAVGSCPGHLDLFRKMFIMTIRSTLQFYINPKHSECNGWHSSREEGIEYTFCCCCALSIIRQCFYHYYVLCIIIHSFVVLLLLVCVIIDSSSIIVVVVVIYIILYDDHD